jgi:thiol-disulfide isomerase/thioredoxin
MKRSLHTLLCAIILLTGSVWAQPDWATLELTNAATGETFTLADFAGQTVLVETMATWCTNCRRQLGYATAAMAELDDSVVFIALSLEPNMTDAQLAAYAEREGFTMTFAVITAELLQGLVTTFGRSITSPPSTPHFVLWPDGTHSELFTGFKQPDALVSLLAGE